MLANLFKYLAVCIVTFFVLAVFILYFAVEIISHSRAEAKQCDTVLVEGWLYDSDLEHFTSQLKKYKVVYTVGDRIDRGVEYFPYDNFAQLTKDRLIRRGINSDNIIYVKSHSSISHTSQAMKNLSMYVDGQKCIDIITSQGHSARTYSLAFNRLNVRNINIFYKRDEMLQNNKWLYSSSKFKKVIMEIVAIVHSKVIH